MELTPMELTLVPMRRDDRLVLERRGEVLVLNGEDVDFSALPDGATLPRAAVDCAWLAADIHRENGVLRLALILPHGPKAPFQTRFPVPVTVTGDGPVALPPQDGEDRDED